MRPRHGYAKWGVMPTDQPPPEPAVDKPADDQASESRPSQLSPAAQRALAEATARRAERDRNPAPQSKEVQGRGGLEPTRYGDWEKKGIASDF